VNPVLRRLRLGTVAKYSRGVPSTGGTTSYSTWPGVASRSFAVQPVTAAQNRACALASAQSKVMLTMLACMQVLRFRRGRLRPGRQALAGGANWSSDNDPHLLPQANLT
jgi:hypothetical protein